MTAKSKKAEELFLMGYGCAQAILGAFEDETGLPFDTSMKIASGFGGGMGRMREVCGTMSGAFMVLGLVYSSDIASVENKSAIYARIKELADTFKEKNGTIVCRELLANVKTTKGTSPEERTEDYYKRRPCLAHIIYTAEILEEYIKSHPKENV